MLQFWKSSNPYFIEREKILRESIEAYIQENYYLTVYSLLPQIEGIISDYLINSKPPKELESILLSPEKKLELIEESILNLDTMITQLIKPAFSPLLNLYKFTNFLKCERTEFNRHAILHGISTQFGTKANALKLILFIDFIFSLINFIDNK